MPELDRYAPFLLSAFGVTWVVLGAYLLYLRSRLDGLRRQMETLGSDDVRRGSPGDARS